MFEDFWGIYPLAMVVFNAGLYLVKEVSLNKPY
jgi:hypothetical protein